MVSQRTDMQGGSLSRPTPANSRRLGVVNFFKTAVTLIAFLAALALVWEIFATFGNLNRLLFPSLGSVFGRFWTLLVSGELLDQSIATLGRMFVGYLVAILVGVPVGLWMGRSKIAEDLFGPLVSFLLPLPALALVPLFILWFGLTLQAALLIISITAGLPILVNAWSGSKNMDPILPRVAAAFNISRTAFFLKIVLPSSLPSIVIGLRQGLAMAWRAAIGAEFFAVAPDGLGVRMFEAKDYIQMDIILALLLVIMLVSVALDKLVFAPLEARTIRRWGIGEST